MTDQTFGARLKQLRQEAGLTQQELAERAGMNKFSVAKLEQDLYSPTWPTVQALAKALGTNCLVFDGTVGPPDDKPARPKGRPPKPPPAETPETTEKPKKRRKAE